MIELIPATTQDIPTIQQLSNIVWPATFSEILSPQQMKYMMDMMYSVESLTKQMVVDGHSYILVKENNNYVAYLAYETNITDSYTKIHKLYVLPSVQGKGIGRILINYALKEAREAGDKYLRLNVNRYNKALDFYNKIGFNIASTEDNDIGNGFFMEDFVMEITVDASKLTV